MHVESCRWNLANPLYTYLIHLNKAFIPNPLGNRPFRMFLLLGIILPHTLSRAVTHQTAQSQCTFSFHSFNSVDCYSDSLCRFVALCARGSWLAEPCERERESVVSQIQFVRSFGGYSEWLYSNGRRMQYFCLVFFFFDLLSQEITPMILEGNTYPRERETSKYSSIKHHIPYLNEQNPTTHE